MLTKTWSLNGGFKFVPLNYSNRGFGVTIILPKSIPDSIYQ